MDPSEVFRSYSRVNYCFKKRLIREITDDRADEKEEGNNRPSLKSQTSRLMVVNPLNYIVLYRS